MKNKILILIFSLLFLFIWSCDEEPPLGPEIPAQEVELDKMVPVGTVTPFLSLAPGNSPEGIAVDWRGKMYISNTIGLDLYLGEVYGDINQVLKVNNDGSYSLYATLPGQGQARGLTTDWRGNIYVAFATPDPNTNGVYIIKKNRQPKRLKGSENIGSPNSLTFDLLGNLYATSSYGEGSPYEGAVWKYDRRGRKFQLFIKHPLLDGAFHPPTGSTMPGANGIAFYPPNKLYVANTIQSSISRINIGRFGKEPTIELVKQDYFQLLFVDGIAVDIHENVYGVMPTSTLSNLPIDNPPPPGIPPLVKLNPNTGVITPIVSENTDFDTPTNLAFGRGWGNWGSVYIANAAFEYGQDRLAGPGVVKVKVGVFGLGKK